MRPSQTLLVNLFIVGFLILNIGLGIRSLITDDSRFGWGMYSSQSQYRVKYAWIFADGSKKEYQPGPELKGRTRLKLKPGQHSTNYASGTMKAWISAYTRYMFENKAPRMR